MRKRLNAKWWLIPLCILIAVVIFSAVFWDALVVYLAPKTVLSTALTNTVSALSERFAGSPVLILSNTLDFINGNSVLLELDTSNDLVGEIHYDMTLQTQNDPRQIFAEGTVTSNGRSLDLSMYLDKDFAAISSQSLLNGNFYGITYDTFPQDIRKNSLLAFMIGDETLGEWETSIASLQAQMENTLEVPDISEEDMRMLFMGILSLKAEVRKDTLELLRGTQDCFAIRFQANGSQIRERLNYAKMELPFAVDENTVVTADFYLVDNTVMRCSLEVTGTNEEISVTVTPDLKPEADSLNLLYLHNSQGTLESYGATICTDSSEAMYTEEISFGHTLNGVQNNTVIHYQWNHADGALQLELNTSGENKLLEMNLSETAEGFRLETEDFEEFMAVLTGGDDKADSPCTMTVSKGADIHTPAYKNFDQWSLEDLLTLLGSIGSLFGLKIE